MLSKLVENNQVLFAQGTSPAVYTMPSPTSEYTESVASFGGSAVTTSGLHTASYTAFGSRKLVLQWDNLSFEEANRFRRLFMLDTSERLTYLDAATHGRNYLPPLLTRPYLHAKLRTPSHRGVTGPGTTFYSEIWSVPAGCTGASYSVGLIMPANRDMTLAWGPGTHIDNGTFFRIDNYSANAYTSGRSLRFRTPSINGGWVAMRASVDPRQFNGSLDMLTLTESPHAGSANTDVVGWGTLAVLPEATSLTTHSTVGTGRYSGHVELLEVFD